MKPEDVGPAVTKGRKLFGDFGNMPMPTLVALDGGAYGGGLEISLAADIRVAGKVQIGQSSCQKSLLSCDVGLLVMCMIV